MEELLTREHVKGTNLDRLLLNGQPAAIVGPVREETAQLLTAYYGDQWNWWALITGVRGGIWLVRNVYRAKDFPLMLEAGDNPSVLKTSWNSPSPVKANIRTRRSRKVQA